ncbi:hypothetical protein BJY52DRAFT_1228032 [Lactarius psammicola]|nr:hypothetical protein BJY52DRAFT_1228032 [Lactarius psammicola]
MSTSAPLTRFPQAQTSMLGSGVAGLFIQGIESGLVFAQFSQWFYGSDRNESSLLSAVVVFVTVVGFVQSGVCFASAWSQYVQHFGVFSIPTPLVLLLVVSIVVSLWSTASIIRFVISIKAKDPSPSLERIGISWLLLDLILTGILLYYLTRTMKQVYATRTRKRLSRLTNIVWQSALPPTLCTICLCVLYVQFSTMHQEKLMHWPKVIQATIGKLYVLSLFYMINTQPLQPDELPTTFISTLTVPTEVIYTRTRDARGGDISRSEIVTERGPARAVDFAV